MKNFLFNIHNNYNTSRTEITLLGIKFKLYNKKLIKMPDYSKALKKVQEKYQNNQKIRVGFYVSENAKWNAEELYKLFEQSNEFEPVVVASILSYAHEGDSSRNTVQENFEFFKNANKNVVKAYDEDKKEFIPLENFDLDVIFYQQPWGIPDIHNVERTKDFALSCYFRYGLFIFKSKDMKLPLLEKVKYFFISNEEEREIYTQKGFKNLYVTGFPKLDIYKTITRTKPDTEKQTIIYAPHFSYQKNSILRIGTFDKTGEKILEFAKKHSEYNWIFKPHPTLRNRLCEDKKYGEKFVENYYSEWDKIGKVYEKGNYFDLFINSDLMITDSSAFLLEYLPTQKPLIRLENPNSASLTLFGKKLVENAYRTKNYDIFEEIFNNVIKDNKDELLNKRIEFTKTVTKEQGSSIEVINCILNEIKG